MVIDLVKNDFIALPSVGGEGPDPVQDAFDACGALQCGFCQPGMILSAKALLDEKVAPTRDEVRAALSGNLCRCTGYTQIFQAVDLAAARRQGIEPEPPAWVPAEERPRFARARPLGEDEGEA